jgi:hypothetical protein
VRAVSQPVEHSEDSLDRRHDVALHSAERAEALPPEASLQRPEVALTESKVVDQIPRGRAAGRINERDLVFGDMFHIQRMSPQTQQFVTQGWELIGHLCSVENLPARHSC